MLQIQTPRDCLTFSLFKIQITGSNATSSPGSLSCEEGSWVILNSVAAGGPGQGSCGVGGGAAPGKGRLSGWMPTGGLFIVAAFEELY